jgi:hypothetical protein
MKVEQDRVETAGRHGVLHARRIPTPMPVSSDAPGSIAAAGVFGSSISESLLQDRSWGSAASRGRDAGRCFARRETGDTDLRSMAKVA